MKNLAMIMLYVKTLTANILMRAGEVGDPILNKKKSAT